MTLEEHLKRAAEEARGIFSLQGAIVPLVYCIDGNGQEMHVRAPGLGGNDDEKDITAEALRAFFKQKNIKQFVMMMEAWTLDLKGFKPGDPLPRPAHSPDRMEVVILTAADKTGEMMGRIPIIRPENERPYLGELETYRPLEAEGRFVGLLPNEARMQ